MYLYKHFTQFKEKQNGGGKVRTLSVEETKSNEPAFNWVHWPVLDSLCGSGRTNDLGQMHICVVAHICPLLYTLVSTLKSHYDSYIRPPGKKNNYSRFHQNWKKDYRRIKKAIGGKQQ